MPYRSYAGTPWYMGRQIERVGHTPETFRFECVASIRGKGPLHFEFQLRVVLRCAQFAVQRGIVQGKANLSGRRAEHVGGRPIQNELIAVDVNPTR